MKVIGLNHERMRFEPAMILDVGCGSKPRGDVNLDLGPTVLARDSGKHTRANIYASSTMLPFRDDSFSIVHFVGLLHHIKNPLVAWREMVRVCSGIIVGEEPSKFNIHAYLDKYHAFHGFSKRQMIRLCRDPRLMEYRVLYYFNRLDRVNLHITAIKKHVHT